MKKIAISVLLAILMSGCGHIDESTASVESTMDEPSSSMVIVETQTEPSIEEATEVESSYVEKQTTTERQTESSEPAITTEKPVETTKPALTEKQIDVVNIMQYPELPTGCESVSLTILLNHLGYPVDKLTVARSYLPKLDFYWSDGVYCGADFKTTFAGNPESSYSYGCYAPCITTTANTYFEKNEHSAKAYDITGTDFESLLTDYIDNDIPVLIWITSDNLHETVLTSVWTTPDGETVQWVAYEHCVVLTGYDKSKDIIYVSDPLVGNTSYDCKRIKQRYNDLGQQAVYIDTEA